MNASNASDATRHRPPTRRAGNNPRAIHRWTLLVVVPMRAAAWLGLSSSVMSVAIVAFGACRCKPRASDERAGSEPLQPAQALRAGSSDRTRSGSGCPDGRTSSPAAGGRPSASTSSAANWSIGTSARSEGKPIEPPRGRTQSNVPAHRSKNPSSSARLSSTIPRDRARTRSRARSADQREDFARRRRADRRVVLEPGAAGEQRPVLRRQPADPQPGQRERLGHDAERDAQPGQRVGAGRQPVRLVDFEVAVDLVGQEVDAPRAAQASVSVRHSSRARQHPRRVVRRVHDDQPRLGPDARHEPVDVERPAVRQRGGRAA